MSKDERKMAEVFLTFFGIFCTLSAIIYGAYILLRFENFDPVRVHKFLQTNRPNKKEFVVGHRGTTLEGPENTLVAFRHAAESGADGVEFDVDFTKDGHAIIIHDATVDRTTDGTGYVSDYTLEEIKKLNAAGDFKNRQNLTFTQVPTLVETIETCLELEIKMFIEIKAYRHSVKAALLLKELFRKYDLYEKAIVLSFYPNVVYQVRRADPKIMVIQNWITRHMSYNRDGTPKHSQWWMTKVTRSLDYLLELSVHSWLFHILRFPLRITHHSEASGFYVQRWKESN
ncbi:glycerophosphodiester phosphodiesterase 1-like [Dendronephthya gigantea]|uniref:glycerophosphodiester phosphodiesterase 1-like n=1 Tax=Dendronephthya gigantea TaxID=151771 RepID=UPI001069FECA|nr:glycerophosphodiester phosphodiesterase 1-like [Dendronephthya gigantea]